jgi:hypothetical protein
MNNQSQRIKNVTMWCDDDVINGLPRALKKGILTHFGRTNLEASNSIVQKKFI